MDLDALERQVTLLEDIQEIENLQRIYGYYFDSHQYDKVVDLFSENAVSAEIESHGVFNGKEGIRRFYWDDIGRKGADHAALAHSFAHHSDRRCGNRGPRREHG